MVSAFSGLLSAFSGTVFPQFQPYSQILPSVLGTAIYIGFMIYCYRSRTTCLQKKGPDRDPARF
jgi:hypothetical protein